MINMVSMWLPFLAAKTAEWVAFCPNENRERVSRRRRLEPDNRLHEGLS